jgi:DNA-binding NtrC family response regulator
MSAAQLKILAIDDEQLLLLALQRAGRGRALDIKTATTIQQALTEIEHCHYDLFLLDFDLNDPGRLALLAAIDERCPYVPIIFMTTVDKKSPELNESIRAVRKRGAWHLLEKPFSLDKMVNFIGMIFQDRNDMAIRPQIPAHNYDQEKRSQNRRPHVQPVSFSFKSIIEGVSSRVSAMGILTDISDSGTGILANAQVKPEQVVSFEDNFIRQNGIVAWSVMINKETCRFGVQFC